MMDKVEELEVFANKIRRGCLDMALSAGKGGCHVGGGFSCIEILAVLFGRILRVDAKNPTNTDRDRFIASKAHCILPHFTALALKGFADPDKLLSFHDDAGFFAGHPWRVESGLEFSGGSLGMGLSLGIGMALAAKRRGMAYKTYVLLGDGESNEGAVWEAFMAAAHFKLDNLIAIVDFNNMQFDGPCSEIMGIDPLDRRIQSFGWEVRRVNGHDITVLLEAFATPHHGKPLAIVADTVKARGIPGLENRAESHHAVLTQEMFDAVVRDMEGGAYGRL